MVIDDVAVLLVAEGHGTLATDLFKYQLPDIPDTCIALRAYGSAEPEFTHDNILPAFERPRFQVVARAPIVADAMAAAQAVWLTLNAVHNSLINGTFYQRIHPLQSVFPIERDENNRWVCGANFEVNKEV